MNSASGRVQEFFPVVFLFWLDNSTLSVSVLIWLQWFRANNCRTDNDQLLFLNSFGDVLVSFDLNHNVFIEVQSFVYGVGGLNGSFKKELKTDTHRTKFPLGLDLAPSGILEYNTFR
jgi:hypothetical protein